MVWPGYAPHPLQVLRDLLRSVQWMSYRATVRDEQVRDVDLRRAEVQPNGIFARDPSSPGLPEPFVHTSVKDATSSAAFARSSAAAQASVACVLADAKPAPGSSFAAGNVRRSSALLSHQELPLSESATSTSSLLFGRKEGRDEPPPDKHRTSSAWLSLHGSVVHADMQRVHAIPRTAIPQPPPYIAAEIADEIATRSSEDSRLDVVKARHAERDAEISRRSKPTVPAPSLLLSLGGVGGARHPKDGVAALATASLRIDVSSSESDYNKPAAATAAPVAATAPGTGVKSRAEEVDGRRREIVQGADGLLGRHVVFKEFSLLPTTGDGLVQHMSDLAAQPNDEKALSLAQRQRGQVAEQALYDRPAFVHDPALANELAHDASRRRRSITLAPMPLDEPQKQFAPLLSLGLSRSVGGEGSESQKRSFSQLIAGPPSPPLPASAALHVRIPEIDDSGGEAVVRHPHEPPSLGSTLKSSPTTSNVSPRSVAGAGVATGCASVTDTVPLRHLLKSNATSSHIASMGLLSQEAIASLHEHHERLRRSASWVVAAATTNARGYYRQPPPRYSSSIEMQATPGGYSAALTVDGVNDEPERSQRAVAVASWPWTPGFGRTAGVVRAAPASPTASFFASDSSPRYNPPALATGAVETVAVGGGARIVPHSPLKTSNGEASGSTGSSTSGHKSYKLLRPSPTEAYKAQVAQLLSEFGSTAARPPLPPSSDAAAVADPAPIAAAASPMKRFVQRSRRASIDMEQQKAPKISHEKGGGGVVVGLRCFGIDQQPLPRDVTQLKMEQLELPSYLKQHQKPKLRQVPLPQPGVALNSLSAEEEAAASVAAESHRMRLPFHLLRMTDMVVHAPLDPAIGAMIKKRRTALLADELSPEALPIDNAGVGSTTPYASAAAVRTPRAAAHMPPSSPAAAAALPGRGESGTPRTSRADAVQSPRTSAVAGARLGDPLAGQQQKPLQSAGAALVKARVLLQPQTSPHPQEERMQLQLLLKQQQATKYDELSSLARAVGGGGLDGGGDATPCDVGHALQAIIRSSMKSPGSPRAAATVVAPGGGAMCADAGEGVSGGQRQRVKSLRSSLSKSNPQAAYGTTDLSARLNVAMALHAGKHPSV
jgi:hypothetical protein